MKEEFRVKDTVELNGKQGIVSQIREDGTILVTFSYSREESESDFPTNENILFSTEGRHRGWQTLGKLKLISRGDHVGIYQSLYISLNSLLSSFIRKTGKKLTDVTVSELLSWSYDQIKESEKE